MWLDQAVQLVKATIALSVSAMLIFSTALGIEKPPTLDGSGAAAYRIEGQLRTEQLKIPILMYHDISEQPSRWNTSTVSPE